MKTLKKCYLGLMLLLLMVAYACKPAQNEVVDVEAEKLAIQAVIDEYMTALDALDTQKILDLKTEDHLEMPPGIERLVGKEAYKDYFNSYIDFFKGLDKNEMNFKVYEFVVTGDWAFQIGTYHLNFVMQNGYSIEDKGNYLWMFRKETDGQWKWARVISNSSLPKEPAN